MNQSEKTELRFSLQKVIEKWWQELSDPPCYVGDDGISFMTEAALSVVFSLSDLEEYLKREGLFKENKI